MKTKSHIKRRYKTDFLFSQMNFTVGAGSVLNLAGNYYEFNTSASDNEADLKALNSDWSSVGNDISESIKKILSK